MTFDGSASSDPQREPLTYLWDLGGGSSSTNASTSKAFAVPGTYSVALSVKDSAGLTSTAATTITAGEVPTPTPTPSPTNTPTLLNLPPVVDPGLAQTSISDSPITLKGTVIDDGLPSGILKILWSKVRGPGALTFSSAASATSGVTASTVGTLLVKLEASDNTLRSSKNGLLTVNPSGTAFEVSSLSLINAATGAPVPNYATIQNGATINLSDLGASPQINVRANLSGSGAASVQWMLDATAVSVDNNGPFALAPSTTSSYPAWAYNKQLYRITAVPSSGSDASGTQGAALSIQFTLR